MISAAAAPIVWCEPDRKEEWHCRPGASRDWLQPDRPPTMGREVVIFQTGAEHRERREARPGLTVEIGAAVARAAVEQGVSVSNETLAYARGFSTLIPHWLPTPDISVYPDGDIAFEWHHDRMRVFTVLVDELGKLHYAGLFGDSDTHGTERCTDELPASIIAGIQRAMGDEPEQPSGGRRAG